MSKLLGSLKSIFSSKKAPKYKNYQASELKIIAIKSRLILDQIYKKSLLKIQEFDSQLIQVTENSSSSNRQTIFSCYGLLQQIGKKVVEAQSIKIYIEILKKIQNNSAYLINTNGDIAKLKHQVRWFQCILWYRKCLQLKNLQEIHHFCFNFFKGLDLTMEINVKCEIFQLYPILKYLSNNIVLPLEILIIEINQYITPKISEELMNQVYKINHHELKKWMHLQKNQAKKRTVSRSPRNISFSPSNKNKLQNNKIQANNYKNISSIQFERPQKINESYQLEKELSKKLQIQLKNAAKNDTNLFQSFGRPSDFINQNKLIKGQNQKHYLEEQNVSKKPSLGRLFSNTSFSAQSQKEKDNEISQQVFQQQGTLHTPKKVSLSRLFSLGNSDLQNKESKDQNQQFKESLQMQYSILQNSEKQKQEALQVEKQDLSKQRQNSQKVQHVQQSVLNKQSFNRKEAESQVQQQYFDQQQSLSFIKACIQIQKKGIKKAYMVSIYGRQQYVNMRK